MNHSNTSGESEEKGKTGKKWAAGVTFVSAFIVISFLQSPENLPAEHPTSKIDPSAIPLIAEPLIAKTPIAPARPAPRQKEPLPSPSPVVARQALSPVKIEHPLPSVAEAPVVARESGRQTTEVEVAEEVLRQRDGAPKPETERAPGGKAYVKIGASGERLAENAEKWLCVEDTQTGLVWEVKSAEPGLRNRDNLYSWYQPKGDNPAAGRADGGRCGGKIACDSYAFMQALNQERLCGYDDWRLPTRDEMLTLVERKQEGAIAGFNRAFFPQGPASWYWTATTNEDHPDYAWYLLFRNGIALADKKGHAKHLRLVRSAPHPVS